LTFARCSVINERAIVKIDLSGKTAVVTGSTAGIGFAIAKGLAEASATVVVNGRSRDAVDRALAALKHATPGATLQGVAADVSTAAGCAALVDAVPSADILVNNVGIYGPQDFFDLPDSEWTRFFEVNVMSGVRLARAYVPGMLKRTGDASCFSPRNRRSTSPPT
jgi:NAD(P)-dependent dehydrogenase (short-subunit alcohol dehydrogenase family)